jgi:hypothetical protein
VYLDETAALEPIDTNVPWTKGRELIASVRDCDQQPELDERTVLPDEDDVNWRLAVAAEINRAGCELMSQKHIGDAIMKFDKVVKKWEYH